MVLRTFRNGLATIWERFENCWVRVCERLGNSLGIVLERFDKVIVGKETVREWFGNSLGTV